jgi:hypothetical protein
LSGLTVITTTKNEGAFPLAWVAHDKAPGLATHHATRAWPATSILRSALKQAMRSGGMTAQSTTGGRG